MKQVRERTAAFSTGFWLKMRISPALANSWPVSSDISVVLTRAVAAEEAVNAVLL